MFSTTSPLRRTFLNTIRNNSINRTFTPLTTSRSFSAAVRKMSEEQGGVHNILSKPDWDAALKGDELVVLDCFATWCGPCKAIAPQVVNFSKTYSDAKFYKVDVDDVPDVAQELGIRAMPTFILFKKGDKVGEIVGANPKALEAAIQKNI